jgi:cytochrome c biogenesis protein CcmG, thiol:disulfide interchange protein DsbE
MWRFVIPIGLFAALIAFFYVGLGRDKETLPSPLIGKPAPQFDLPTVEDPNRRVSTRDFAGKPYVVNIWGTWCPGCRQEHPVLLEIAQRDEVPLLGIDWKDDLGMAQQWLREYGNPYEVTAFDSDGRVSIDWGAYGAPETFLVDAQGTVIHKHVGPLSMEAWERDFVPKLAGDDNSTPKLPGGKE